LFIERLLLFARNGKLKSAVLMDKRYRFLLIQAFHLPKESQYLHRAADGPKESMLMNYEPLPRPPNMGQSAVHLAKNRAQRGETSEEDVLIRWRD
jgi:hypothetical protein